MLKMIKLNTLLWATLQGVECRIINQLRSNSGTSIENGVCEARGMAR